MTTIVLPLDASSGAPTFNAQQTRQAFSAFLGAAPTGRPLGAISGVRPGTPTTTVTVSGTTWSCAAHSGVLDVEASAVAGPYLYATDGSDTGSITAADGTNPRVDIIYVQVSDNVQDSSGSEAGTVGYLAGTPAASPVAPAAPARSMVLAQISVPVLGGGNASVSWVVPTFGLPPEPSYEAHKSGTQATADTTITNVTFDVIDRNIGSMRTNNTTATITTAGLYAISGGVNYQPSGATGAIAVIIQVNGNMVATNTSVLTANTLIGSNAEVSSVKYLNAGDTVTLATYHNGGVSLTIDGTVNAGCWIRMARIGS